MSQHASYSHGADVLYIDQHVDTALAPDAGVALDRAADGTARGRRLYAATQWEITVVHDPITRAELDALDAWWALHRSDRITWTYQASGASFLAILVNDPEPKHLGGDLWRAVVKLTGERL